MITYHQTFDIYHTIYRISKILELGDFDPMEKDRLRIFDFLIVFPHELKNVQVPTSLRSIKRAFKETKYNQLSDRKRVFTQTGKFFENSLQSLFSYGLLDVEKYKANIIWVPDSTKARKISSIINHSFSNEILEILKETFLKMNLSELKKRSGLIEYRYDLL
jgi:hypothetical protein